MAVGHTAAVQESLLSYTHLRQDSDSCVHPVLGLCKQVGSGSSRVYQTFILPSHALRLLHYAPGVSERVMCRNMAA